MRRLRTLLALSLALTLAACGGKASAGSGGDAPEADEATVTMSETLPDEPYEAVAYGMHPAPEGGYVGDVMPFVTEDGQLELYYLYDTSHNGQGYHPIYQFSTSNLYEYEDHGMVLNFGQGSDPDPALGTGSVMQDKDGVYHLFYTGHNDTGNNGRGKECAYTEIDGIVHGAEKSVCQKGDIHYDYAPGEVPFALKEGGDGAVKKEPCYKGADTYRADNDYLNEGTLIHKGEHISVRFKEGVGCRVLTEGKENHKKRGQEDLVVVCE
jgi:hypothetical protein